MAGLDLDFEGNGVRAWEFEEDIKLEVFSL